MVYSPGSLYNLPENMKTSIGKKRNFTPNIKSIRATLDRIVAMDREIMATRQYAAKLQVEAAKMRVEYRRLVQHEIPRMEKVRRQLARRAGNPGIGPKGQNLLTGPLNLRERERLKAVARMVKNMSAGVRTVRRLPLPSNIGLKIARMTAR